MKTLDETYDEVSNLVNAEIALLGETATFANLKQIDQKLDLPITDRF